MEISGENLQGMTVKGTKRFGVEIKHKRRVLSDINQNLIGVQIYKGVVKKTVAFKTHQNCVKNTPNVVPQPTRKFDTENSDVGDVAIVDAQEHKDQMEIDVENAFEEIVMNIDGCDSTNLLQVVEYVDDLYAYYKKMESSGCVSPNYMAQQGDINEKMRAILIDWLTESSGCVSPNYMAQQGDINEKMRAILIDWLTEVHHKFDLREETLFLTVNLTDRFLAQQGVVRKKLQLVGLVALLLACKYEEVSVPIVDDLIFISDKAYTRTEILETEKLMLHTLQFNMSLPTSYVFMNRFLKAAQADRKLELLSFFLIELCLVEYEMIKYMPSFLSACAIYTAQCTIFGHKQWNKTCEWYTSYPEDQLLECSKLIVSFHKKASTGRLTGIHRKYSTSKFDCIAKTEPANFLADT